MYIRENGIWKKGIRENSIRIYCSFLAGRTWRHKTLHLPLSPPAGTHKGV